MTDKKTSAKEFLDVVGGMSYIPEDTLAVEMAEHISSLKSAHENWGNYDNEVSPAKYLLDLLLSLHQKRLR